MKIIEPQFEIWEQSNTLEGIYKQIERVARTCYKSNDKIAEGTAEKMVNMLMKNHHGAMLEHGTIYLKIPTFVRDIFYEVNQYSKCNISGKYKYITTNYRVLYDNEKLVDLKYLCEPTEHHEKRVCVHFTTQIAITREFNRHRVNSIAEESTRYCNYSKDKFGGEISVNLPSFIDKNDYKQYGKVSTGELFEFCAYTDDANALDWWILSNRVSEMAYLKMIEGGCKPQEARTILPLDTNTGLTHTAFVSDWIHFFDLRAVGTTGKPHPDAKALAEPLMKEFKRRGLIERDYGVTDETLF